MARPTAPPPSRRRSLLRPPPAAAGVDAPPAAAAAPAPAMLPRNALIEMGEKNVPVEERIFGERGALRPNFFVPYLCKNVLIEDVTIINSPMWEINPVLSTNVT